MTMNQRDAQALTYLAGRLREETRGASKWDEHGTYTVVARLIGQNLATSIEQVVRHAGDVEAKTPGAIQRPFLPPPAAPDNKARPPRRDEECQMHPGKFAENCGGCHADELAGDEKPLARTNRADPTTGAAACRAALKEGA